MEIERTRVFEQGHETGPTARAFLDHGHQRVCEERRTSRADVIEQRLQRLLGRLLRQEAGGVVKAVSMATENRTFVATENCTLLGEDVSAGADILPVMPVGRVGLDAGSGATGVLANTRRDAAEPAVT